MKIAMYIASTGSLVDKIIDAWTGWYGYSHSEIVFDHIARLDNTYLTCSSSPRDGKLRFNRIDMSSGHWYMVDIPEIYSEKQEYEIYNMLKKMEGAKYDWKGIFFYFIFSFVHKQDDNEWWCSEICAYIINRFINPNFKYRISPNKLAKKLKAPKQPYRFGFSWKKSY